MFEEHVPILGAVLAKDDAWRVRSADPPHPFSLDVAGRAETVPEKVDGYAAGHGLELVGRLEKARRRSVAPQGPPEKHLPPALGNDAETHGLEEPCGQEPLGSRQVAIGRRRDGGTSLPPRGFEDSLHEPSARPQTGRLLHDVQTRKRQDPLAEWTPRRDLDGDSVSKPDRLAVEEGRQGHGASRSQAPHQGTPPRGTRIDLGGLPCVRTREHERLVLGLRLADGEHRRHPHTS